MPREGVQRSPTLGSSVRVGTRHRKARAKSSKKFNGPSETKKPLGLRPKYSNSRSNQAMHATGLPPPGQSSLAKRWHTLQVTSVARKNRIQN